MTQREFWQEHMLKSMAAVLTPEQYAKMENAYNAMSDYEFLQLIAEAGAAASENVSYKDYLKATRDLLRAGGLTTEDTVAGNSPVGFMNDQENGELWRKVQRSKPSDMVCINGAQDKQIIGLWRDRAKEKGVSIPSDIFFAGTVPLMDCLICVDERDAYPNGKVCEYRVVIFEDAMRQIRELPDDETIVVGTIVLTERGHSLLIPMRALKGFDSLLGADFGYHNMPQKLREKYSAEISVGTAAEMFIELLQTWYGIQIALLHPLVKNVFRHPRTERVYDPPADAAFARKRRTRYIKKHIINKDELENAIYGDGSRGFTRRTLVWYVIGHWRTLASGAKVFVRPTWKGPLRDLKMNLDEREREIAQLYEGGTANA